MGCENDIDKTIQSLEHKKMKEDKSGNKKEMIKQISAQRKEEEIKKQEEEHKAKEKKIKQRHQELGREKTLNEE